jgi:RNA polymerase sigma factor (sigma-70 family)
VEESELVALAAAGDAEAFARLVEACRERTWAVCFRITGNAADAEDALQDALVAAWRNLHSFRGHARFSTWLYRIASNAALAVVRRRRDIPDDGLVFSSDETTSFAQSIVDADAVQAALGKLPPTFRAALVLREWGGLSYQEIGDWQGVGVQTVKSRLNRARNALAELLTEVAANHG